MAGLDPLLMPQNHPWRWAVEMADKWCNSLLSALVNKKNAMAPDLVPILSHHISTAIPAPWIGHVYMICTHGCTYPFHDGANCGEIERLG